jgi:hypothetical protein
VVEDFLEATAPAGYDHDRWRRCLIDGVGEESISGGAHTRMAVLDAMGAAERSAT